MKICVVGAGYVGLVTAACLSELGHDVSCLENDREKLRILNKGQSTIYEPGLSKIIKECRGKNLHFSCNFEENIKNADLIFISVNTPTKESGIGAGKAIDLKWVEESTRTIANYACGKTIIVEKSTLPVRTAQTIKEILETSLKNSKDQKEFHVMPCIFQPDY